MLLPAYDAAPAFDLLSANAAAGWNRRRSDTTSSPLGLQVPRHGRVVQGERFATEVAPWSMISPHGWHQDTDFLIGTHKLSDALGHSTSTTTWVSHWATLLPLMPKVLSERYLTTLYNNNTTQPTITLRHMATLLSCVRVVPGSDPGQANKQRNDETKSVTRAPPIPSTSYPISHWSSSTALSHHNSTHSDRNTMDI